MQQDTLMVWRYATVILVRSDGIVMSEGEADFSLAVPSAQARRE